jgi:hypothetical protein
MSGLLYIVLTILYPVSKQGKEERNKKMINYYMDKHYPGWSKEI